MHDPLERRAIGIRYTRFMGDESTAGRAHGGWINAYCDGGSRGNPGPSGFGVYIQDEQNTVLAELSEYLGTKTNNYAEYSGLLAALDFAITQGHKRLRVVSDSELMVKQIQGKYRVNSPELRPLYEEAKRRIAKLESFELRHVLRDKNRHADRLANLAMDRGMGREPESGRGGSIAKDAVPGPRLQPENPRPQVVRGFVKGGVVHLLGVELPEGVFVKVTRE